MAEYIQHCFGEYERRFCNGDAKSDDIYESLPCTRRDVCEAFRLYLEEVEKDRVEYFTVERGEDEHGEEFFYVALEDQEAFLGFCGKLVDRYGTHAKRIRKKRYKVVDKPKKALKKKEKKRDKKKRKERYIKLIADRSQFLESILENFRVELSAKLPFGCAVVEDGVFPLPGQLFIINRAKASIRGTISVYLKGYASKDIELVRLISYRGKRKFLAIFVFEKDEVENCLGKDLVDLLDVEETKVGCKTKALDKVGVSLLAESIALFFEKGMISVRKMVEN